MGIHVGSFTLGGIVGAGVLGYFVMKSPIGCEIKQCALDVAKKKAEEGIHFLLWGDSDKRGPEYKEHIPRDNKGRADYTEDLSDEKDIKVGSIYFTSAQKAKNAFNRIFAEIVNFGYCSVHTLFYIADRTMTHESGMYLEIESSDGLYGWDKTDMDSFRESNFEAEFISGKGWQFCFPRVHRVRTLGE